MGKQRQPEQQAPPVQKIRLRYAKRDRARFTSHRDFGRAFERALRRAHIPMAYSSGFNPHPRISYANASPTGAATEAEYLEIGLWEVCDPTKVMVALNDVLPPGLRICGAQVAQGGSLADGLDVSHWQIQWSVVDPDQLDAAVTAFLAAEEVMVERMMKNGLRTFDARGPVVALRVMTDADITGVADESTADTARWGGLDVIVRHDAPLVRPGDVLMALAAVSSFEVPVGARHTRVAQGRLEGDAVVNLF